MIPIVMSLGSCALSTGDETDTAETYSTEARLDKSFVMQEATDKLTLYSYTMNSDMITPAVNIFSEMYPDVSVDVVSLSDKEYVNLLSAECTVVNDKLQKTQKIKTQARGDQKRWI